MQCVKSALRNFAQMASFVLLALFFSSTYSYGKYVAVYGSQFHYDFISLYGLEAGLKGRRVHALSHPGSKLSPDET